MDKKTVMMALPTMAGGGAEHIAALLVNEFAKNGYRTQFVLTQVPPEKVVRCDLEDRIPLTVLREQYEKSYRRKDLGMLPMRLISSLLCRCFERFGKRVPSKLAYLSFYSQYHLEIKQMHNFMRQDPTMTVIAFLQPTIPIVLLAARGLPNRVIVSERADPQRLMRKRYGWNFVNRYYSRADAVIFQTEIAQNAYPKHIAQKGTIICNPIKSDLPEPHVGARNTVISTFCRISKQKNLPLLLRAFCLFHAEYPEYTLRIIGDALNAEGILVLEELQSYLKEKKLSDYVCFEPFCTDVHTRILKDAMYVNSSDYEGISNAMLEAMAIGMPVICTDCPIGGAKQTITDGENGLLVPINDESALYQAMKRLAENPDLAKKLSEKAVSLRQELSIDKIAQKWMEKL